MEWLKSLREVIHNWEKSWMRFQYQGKTVQLQGILAGQQSHASLHKWLQVHTPPTNQVISRFVGTGSSLRMKGLCLSEDRQGELANVLQKFDVVFQALTSLPLSRPQDYRINLLNHGTDGCVRPYRYPYVQKTEIERQVQELLSLGMLRPSKSAFSSRVILVKKRSFVAYLS